jgi:glycerol-3-phosphate acyltransferase PlsY
LALLAFQRPEAAALFFVLTILIWIMHRANIRRLLNGGEGKIGAKA